MPLAEETIQLSSKSHEQILCWVSSCTPVGWSSRRSSVTPGYHQGTLHSHDIQAGPRALWWHRCSHLGLAHCHQWWGSSKRLVKLKPQGPSFAWALRLWGEVGGAEGSRWQVGGRWHSGTTSLGALLVNCLKRSQSPGFWLARAPSICCECFPLSMLVYTDFCIWDKNEAPDLIFSLWVTHFSITGSSVEADLS